MANPAWPPPTITVSYFSRKLPPPGSAIGVDTALWQFYPDNSGRWSQSNAIGPHASRARTLAGILSHACSWNRRISVYDFGSRIKSRPPFDLFPETENLGSRSRK